MSEIENKNKSLFKDWIDNKILLYGDENYKKALEKYNSDYLPTLIKQEWYKYLKVKDTKDKLKKSSWFERLNASFKKNNITSINDEVYMKIKFEELIQDKEKEFENYKNKIDAEYEKKINLLKDLSNKSVSEIKEKNNKSKNQDNEKINLLQNSYKILKTDTDYKNAELENIIKEKENIIKQKDEENLDLKAKTKFLDTYQKSSNANTKLLNEKNETLSKKLIKYESEISNLEKEFIKSKDLNKVLEDDLNKLTQEKNINEIKIKNELDMLKKQIKNIELVNNDLLSENQDLNNKLISKEKEINKKLINAPNIDNKISNKKFSEIYNFEKWMKKNTSLSESSVNKYVNSVSNMRLDLIRMRNIDLFSSKNNRKENLEKLLDVWLSENLEKDKKGNNMYSAGFRKFIIFKSLNDVFDIDQKLTPQVEKNKYKQIQIDNDVELDKLNFSIKVYHSLMRNGCKKLSDIKNLTDWEILGMKNMGESGLLEIRTTIRRYETSSHESFNVNKKDNINLSKSNKTQIINVVKANSNEKHDHKNFLKLYNETKLWEVIKNPDNKNFNELINEINTKVNKISEFNLTKDFLNNLNKFVTIIESLDNVNNYKQHVYLDYLEDIDIYVDKLKKFILSSYIESFFSNSWLFNLNRSLVLPLDKKWIIVIFYLKRFSYSKIGNALLDKLSRERVRQIIKTFQQKLRLKLVLPANDFDNELSSLNIKNDNVVNAKSEAIKSEVKEDINQEQSLFKLDFAKLEQSKLEQKQTDERLNKIYSIRYDDDSEIEEEEENIENDNILNNKNDLQEINQNNSSKLVYRSHYHPLIKFIEDNIDEDEAINKELFTFFINKNSLNEEDFLEEINNFCYEEFNDLLLEEDDDIFYLTKEVFENFKINFNSND